jgi:polysaccharide export outer membrane protein
MKTMQWGLVGFALGVVLAAVPALAATPGWWKDSTREDVGEPEPVPAQDEAPARASSGGPFLEEYLVVPRAAETVAERAAARARPENANTPPAATEAVDTSRYRVQPGDLLVVSVWREPDLTREVRVSPDGWIAFPLVGDVAVEGETVDGVRARLEEYLGRFINEAVVDVSVREPDGNRIYVLGKVNRPGVYPFTKNVDVIQALSLAGGTSKFAALDDIRIVRRVDGQQRTYPFNYSDVERGRKLEQNIVLLSGDVVVVP